MYGKETLFMEENGIYGKETSFYGIEMHFMEEIGTYEERVNFLWKKKYQLNIPCIYQALKML